MVRPSETPVPQSSNEIPSQPQTPQGYPNQHENSLSPPLPPQPQEAYMGNGHQHTNQPQTTRSYVSQSSENLPPPEAYPPQKQETYPTQQTPETYPTQQPHAAYPPQPGPSAYPPQQQPSTYPPQQPSTYPPQQTPAYPPQQPSTYPPQQTPQSYPPQQPTVGNGSPYNPQSYNYNAQPQVNNGGTQMNMGTPNGVPIGIQYLAPTQGWKTGILDCFDDPENAIMTFCFPCVTFGQIAEIVDNGNPSCATSGLVYTLITAFIGIPCIMSCSYRTKLRSRYGLVESPAPDWVIHFFCEYCALCQEYRELKARGMDPAIGWQGNLSRNQQMANYATMTPPMNQTMRN